MGVFVLSGRDEYLIKENIQKISSNHPDFLLEHHESDINTSILFLKENNIFQNGKISVINNIKILDYNLSFLNDKKILIILDYSSKIYGKELDIIKCEKLDVEELHKFVHNKLNEDKFICEKELIDTLIVKYGDNLFKLEKIIEKLELSVNINVITRADFKNIGIIEDRYDIFEVFTHLVNGRKNNIISYIDDFKIEFYVIKKLLIINLEKMIKLISMLNSDLKEAAIMKKLRIGKYHFSNLRKIVVSLNVSKLIDLYFKSFEIRSNNDLKEYILKW